MSTLHLVLTTIATLLESLINQDNDNEIVTEVTENDIRLKPSKVCQTDSVLLTMNCKKLPGKVQ